MESPEPARNSATQGEGRPARVYADDAGAHAVDRQNVADLEIPLIAEARHCRATQRHGRRAIRGCRPALGIIARRAFLSADQTLRAARRDYRPFAVDSVSLAPGSSRRFRAPDTFLIPIKGCFVPKDSSKSILSILRKLSVRVDATKDAEVSMRLTSCEQIRHRDAGRKTSRVSGWLRKSQEREPNSPTRLPHPQPEHKSFRERPSSLQCFFLRRISSPDSPRDSLLEPQ